MQQSLNTRSKKLRSLMNKRKGHEIKAQQQFVDTELNIFFSDIYQGFLTSTEIKQVIEGRDLWFGSAEVQRRWANRNNPLEVKQGRGRPRKT